MTLIPTGGGPWSEVPPVQGVPTPSGSNLNPTLASILAGLQKITQAQAQNEQKSGIAARGTPGQVFPITPPFAQLPIGAPGTPAAAQAAGGGPAAAPATQRQAGPIPSNAPGTGGSGFQFNPPVAYRSGETQMPYYQGGQTGSGIAANAIIGLGNILADKRRADDEKQYIQAEGLWTQVLTAQQNIANAAQQGIDDPADRKLIETILGDDKNRKMIQDTLGVLTTVPGAAGSSDDLAKQQQDQNNPAVRGARGAMQKVLGGIKNAFDPRTAAQRMPAGGTTPINTPGGAMWNFPAPTNEQLAAAEMRRKQAAGLANITPAEWKEIEEVRGDIRIGAKEQANLDAAYQYRQAVLGETIQRDRWRHEDAQARITAIAAQRQVDPTEVQYWGEKFESGEFTKEDLAKVPSKLRQSVMDYMAGKPFANKLTTKMLDNQMLANQGSGLINESRTNLNDLLKKYPELSKSDQGFWENLRNTGQTRAKLALYKNGFYVEPMWAEYFEFAGGIETKGLAPFMQIARNRNMMEIAQIHIPRPTDSPKEIQTKLDWFQKYILEDTQNEINNYKWSGHPVPYPKYMMDQGIKPPPDPYWQKFGAPSYTTPAGETEQEEQP